MKSIKLTITLFALMSISLTRAQILFYEPFTSSIGQCVVTNSNSGTWIWSNNCSLSNAPGHSATGHALFSGAGCQFGNGGLTVSGDLSTPTIAIGGAGAVLSFNYYLNTECQSPGSTCSYDVLRLQISNNGGSTFTNIMASNGNPAGLTHTGQWTPVTYNLSNYINQTIIVRFNFNSGDGVGNAYDGVYVDDIQILDLCNISIFANSGGNPVSPLLCAGNSLTLTTNAVSNYSWSTGSTASSIVVSPAVSTNYSLVATGSLNCVANTAINVTVNPGLPVLAISASSSSICLGDSVALTASGAITYTWSNNVPNAAKFAPSATGNYTVTGGNGCGTSTAATAVTVTPIPVTASNSPAIACAGLISTLSAQAAATNYTWLPYNITGSVVLVNPTVNTVFTVVASDGTCIGMTTLTLNTLPVPTINVVSSTTMTCIGFPVNMSASGALTYTWLPGNTTGPTATVNPAGPTLYTVSGTNSSGCTTQTTQIVVTAPSPTFNVSSSGTLVCPGDQVDLMATGNAAGYIWTGGPSTPGYQVFPQVTSVYTVVGSSSTNTCTTTKMVTVTVFIPVVTVTASSPSVCSGMSVTLTGAGADDYFWSTGSFDAQITVNPVATTIYTLTASSNTANNSLSCSATKSIQILVHPNPTVTASTTRSLICQKESTDLNASGAVNYIWSTGANSAMIIVSPTLITIHTFTLEGTDANGCRDDASVVVRVIPCTGLEENVSTSILFSLYPNPAIGEFTLSSDRELDLKIVNDLGQVVREIHLNGANGQTKNIKDLSAGIYFIMTDADPGHIRKLIVE